jgi:hypothetical protein
VRIRATRQANGSRRAICQGDESGEKLQRLDIRCLLALRPMLDLEGHPLAFLQRFEAFFLNFREVRKEVLPAVVRRDEPEALCIVEPLVVNRRRG